MFENGGSTQMYRDWVWAAVQAINTHCRVEAGFTGLSNVYNAAQVILLFFLTTFFQ